VNWPSSVSWCDNRACRSAACSSSRNRDVRCRTVASCILSCSVASCAIAARARRLLRSRRIRINTGSGASRAATTNANALAKVVGGRSQSAIPRKGRVHAPLTQNTRSPRSLALWRSVFSAGLSCIANKCSLSRKPEILTDEELCVSHLSIPLLSRIGSGIMQFHFPGRRGSSIPRPGRNSAAAPNPRWRKDRTGRFRARRNPIGASGDSAAKSAGTP